MHHTYFKTYQHFAAPPASEAEIKEVVFGDKAEVATEEKEEKRALSAEEIEALVDLSTTSLVDDERKLLQELKKEVSVSNLLFHSLV